MSLMVELMKSLLRTVLLCVLAPAMAATAADDPLTASVKAPQENVLVSDSMKLYEGVQKILLRSAELTPEEDYGFRPAESVRTFGQIVGHVADAQYLFCSAVVGEKSPRPGIEKSRTSKADLIKELKESFAYCDRAYDGMTDASAAQMVKLMGGEKPKLGVLSVNNVHTIEHYGNLVTYMRMRNLVPPTSDRAFMQQLQKK